MFGLEWMKTFVMLLLLLRGSATVLHQTGSTISLSCQELTVNQKNCNATTWLFKSSRSSDFVELVAFGQIVSTVEVNKGHRLHLLENCSLEIKDVTVKDSGRYHCKQHLSKDKNGPETYLELALVSMSETLSQDTATLSCTVATYERCKMKVHFSFGGGDQEKTGSDLSSHYSCTTSKTFPVYQTEFKSRLTSSWCIVEYDDIQHKFPFYSQPSGRNTGTTTPSTTVPNKPPTVLKDWWWGLVAASVLLALACTLTCVTVFWCRRNKERNTNATENANQEDGVFYTSLNFTRKGKNRDENVKRQHETVTYVTVKAFSMDPKHI